MDSGVPRKREWACMSEYAHLGPLENGGPVVDIAADDVLFRRRADEVGYHVCPVAEDLQQPLLLAPGRILPASRLLVEAVPATRQQGLSQSCCALALFALPTPDATPVSDND